MNKISLGGHVHIVINFKFSEAVLKFKDLDFGVNFSLILNLKSFGVVQRLYRYKILRS